MEIKKSASLAGLQMPMRKALIAADIIWRELGQELVVTCGTDGVHSAGSLHYYGYALDFRTRYFDRETRNRAASMLKRALGSEYDVIVHETHIHVEYQKILVGLI